jgi:hypothetical protein
MTTTAIIAVLAALRQRSSLSDPPKPCVPVEDSSSTLKTGAIDATAVEAVLEQAHYKDKILSGAREGPTLTKPDSTRQKNEDDSPQENVQVHRYSSLAMRTRIESLETRCDWYERALQQLACDIGIVHSSSNHQHLTEPCSVTDAVDTALDLDGHTTTASEHQQGEPTASDNPMTKHLPLSESSKNTRPTKGRRSYTTRDLDKLSISGTSKLDLHQNIANTHRKLIRSNKWRNRWSSSGRRWPRRAAEGEK